MLLLIGSAAATVFGLGELVATGDCATAVAQVAVDAPGMDAAEALGVGSCLHRMGKDPLADTVLAEVSGPLAPYARLVRAEGRLDTGDVAGALALTEGLALPGDDDAFVRARALLAAGRATDAATVLGTLKDTARTRLLRARAADPAPAAIPLYREVWARWPTSGEADVAAQRLLALGHPVTDVADAETRAAVLARARKLVEVAQAPLAIPLFDAVHAVAPPASEAERLELADALFEAHVYDRARDAYAAVAAPTRSSRAAFRHALSTARAGDYVAAAPLYAALVQRWPDAKEADEATWKPGYMDYDAGRLREAVAGFDRYLAARGTGKFAAEARWLRAWSLYKLGDTPAALTAMAPIAAGGGEFAAPAAYWTARAKGDDAALAAVATRFPRTSYAWFVAERLGAHAAKPPPPPPPALGAAFLTEHPNVATARLLADAGFPAWARAQLDTAPWTAPDGTTAVAMAALLVDAEAYGPAKKLACPQVGKVPGAAALCTPRPYADTVGPLTGALGLDPLLPYAIMNAESGLDPSVTSPAGARGLMQLMPLLAAPLAEGRVPGFVADDLYRAGINTRLGVTELGQLQARFAGARLQPALPLVVAGYNGGGDAVQRWLDAAPADVALDRWAEDISFSETRKYVRRVLGYLMEYRAVYGG